MGHMLEGEHGPVVGVWFVDEQGNSLRVSCETEGYLLLASVSTHGQQVVVELDKSQQQSLQRLLERESA